MAEARGHVTLDELMRLRHRAKGFSFLPRQPVHSLLNGRHASRLRGRGLEFEELRHYVEGDDTRTIDWPATARLGSAFVRVFTEERDRAVVLLVDQRLTMFFGSRHATKSVAAAEAAALSAWRVTSLGDRVGAVVFSENGLVEVAPQGRERAVVQVLHAVVGLNRQLDAADPREADPALLNEALRRTLRHASHDGLICLITDAYGADQETVRLVTQLTAHNDVLTVFVFDPLEAELPDIGEAIMGAGTQQIEVDTSASRLRSSFSAAFTARRDAIEHVSRRRAIPMLSLSCARPTQDQFREQLGRQITARRFHGVAATVRP